MPSLSQRLGKNNALLRGVFDGWQISGITRFVSGNPYDIGFSIPGIGSPQITGSYTEGSRVRIVGSPTQGIGTDPYRRINPAAYAPPLVGSIGMEAPRNYMVAPGIDNWDISVQKEIVTRERLRWQFRVDAFNAFNHTQFSGINTTINFAGLTNPSVTNLAFNPDGSVRDKNGFGTVSGARDPRILQMMVRIQF